ncbi:MAG TPA: ABC transporter ATP-binding protein [Syntrophothermus lipocalidus]|uniref:ABC transporter related protein n=1 Tax=Syntrophothermus lipocalidus (strain DSM 12680 / TGB-C1) TaxID=643648 RepID=D7CL69_SYNLT|nr:ABC transporter ATP-binding protein [Syntrophothermus lipocalidus]ADI01454.1 ABC transporter related protein [Syntrophothermus lipocalidus DSM 12680]HHV76046.1 ABC transporter ATP-binding protein [Syntrophothermus lipocalidus]
MGLLKIDNVSHEFGGLRALDRVSLAIEKGEIFGLIGPNGAGKTTLFNLISGIYKPTEGQVFFKGRPIHNLAPHKISRLGVGRTFQNIRLFKKLSVVDNVKVGMHGVIIPEAADSKALGWGNKRKIEQRADELLNLVGLYEKRMEYAESLAYGEQRRLEIARALARNPCLLLLDEPAAGMNNREKEELMQLVGDIRDMGITILLVEHDMNVVMNVCDRIAVLDYGKKIAEGDPVSIRNDARVIQSYLGVGA